MPTHWKPRSVFASDADHLADLGATMDAPGQFRLDVSQDCSNPRWVEVSYTDQHRSKFRTWRGNVEYLVACRRCQNCTRRRRRHWTARIVKELRQADRSWFGTLTVEPEQQYLAALRAERDCLRRGVRWSDMNSKERFNAIVQALAPDLTRWLKRVRKNSGAYVRYCLVAEEHKSGLPHFHVVLHHRAIPVRHKTLKEAWTLGFSDFKLVEEKLSVARYVAKYLAKALGARVRASTRYGSNDLGHSAKAREKISSHKIPATEAGGALSIDNAPPASVYVAGAMCPSCGTALENLYGHYDKAHGAGLPDTKRGRTERLSNEVPVCAETGCSSPWEHPQSQDFSKSGAAPLERPLSQAWEAGSTRTEASPKKSRQATASGRAEMVAQGALSDEGNGAVQTEAAAVGIWACPKGCIRDASLSLWQPVGPGPEGAPTGALLQSG